MPYRLQNLPDTGELSWRARNFKLPRPSGGESPFCEVQRGNRFSNGEANDTDRIAVSVPDRPAKGRIPACGHRVTVAETTPALNRSIWRANGSPNSTGDSPVGISGEFLACEMTRAASVGTVHGRETLVGRP